MPVLRASPKLWTESEVMATEPVRKPPTNSMMEKTRLNRKARKMRRVEWALAAVCL